MMLKDDVKYVNRVKENQAEMVCFMDLTKDTLVEWIVKTIQQNYAELRTMYMNTPWEKWFQGELFSNGVNMKLDIQLEDCMGEGDTDKYRYDFVILNTDQRVCVGELKCSCPGIGINNVKQEYLGDITKLNSEQIAYGKFAIMLVPTRLFSNIKLYEYWELNKISQMYEDWECGMIEIPEFDYPNPRDKNIPLEYILFVACKDI